MSAISRIGIAIIVVVIIIVAAVAAVVLALPPSTSTSASSSSTSTGSSATSSLPSSTSSSISSSSSSSVLSTTPSVSSSSSSSAGTKPTTLTWETIYTEQFLDPAVNYDLYGPWAMINMYESLVWYANASSSITPQLVPWLAQNYTVSSDLKTYQFKLRPGITFADGEPLNSTAVYFSFNRELIIDGSTPIAHGTQFTYDIQHMLNTSLSSNLCGCKQTYNPAYVSKVLGQNFVNVSGPLVFSLNVMRPDSAMPYILAGYNYGMMLAPRFVMEHDVALWNQSSTGYTLPYPNLSGNLTQMIHQYFLDEVATCDSGITPNGCGTTYLDGSFQGSMAGTGPYVLKSFDSSSNELIFNANPNYWGGPFQFTGGQKIVPFYTTLDFKFVPSLTTREIDLQNAGKSGQPMLIDLPNTNLYDFANRSNWLNNHVLQSTVPGVTLYGPFLPMTVNDVNLATNVTNPSTRDLYTFQPFADYRFRLAFADSVNMSLLNQQINNNLGTVANDAVPPNVPPTGSHNLSINTTYSFNPDKAQALLLDAMMHPLTTFTFRNGTPASPGFFNNTFGCSSLGSSNTCSAPVGQSIGLYFASGDAVNQGILTEMAGVINNISTTYNMGLTVSVTPIPGGQLLSDQIADSLYVSAPGGFVADYAWPSSYLNALYNVGGFWPTSNGWNITTLNNLYQQTLADSASGNITGLVAATNLMSQLANKNVMYLWTVYPEEIHATSSIVAGLQFMPAIDSAYYFAYYH